MKEVYFLFLLLIALSNCIKEVSKKTSLYINEVGYFYMDGAFLLRGSDIIYLYL